MPDMTTTAEKLGTVSRMLSAARARVFTKATLGGALTVAMVLAVTAAKVYAQGEGGHGEEGFDMDMFIKRVVDFSIIAVGIGFIWVKFIKGALRKRIEGIESALAEAKTAREEALKRLADVEARLKNKDEELARMVSVAEENGKKEKAALIEEGAKMAEDIVASAKENMDAELIKARDELRKEAALMALELAEKMVRENINKEDRSRIVEEYIAKVGG